MKPCHRLLSRIDNTPRTQLQYQQSLLSRLLLARRPDCYYTLELPRYSRFYPLVHKCCLAILVAKESSRHSRGCTVLGFFSVGYDLALGDVDRNKSALQAAMCFLTRETRDLRLALWFLSVEIEYILELYDSFWQ